MQWYLYLLSTVYYHKNRSIADRETDRQTDRHRQTGMCYDAHNIYHKNRSIADRQADRRTDRQTGRQTGRQTDRHKQECVMMHIMCVDISISESAH